MEHCEDEEEMDTAEVSSSSSDSESEEAEEARTEEEQKALWQKVEELRGQVAENALFYDGHVSLITTLRDLFELEEARKAREQMSEVYPLTPELWLQWIQDEQKVCATDEERQYIVSLFERAVKDYTSVQVWVEYVMFMLGGGDLDATRQVGERALTAVGTHVAEGVLVWQVVLLVEKQVYSGLQKPGAVLSDKETADIEKQLSRIQALYRRQMRVPLMNCGPEALQEEASEYFDDIGAQMKEDLKKTQQRLNEKVPYEDELLRAQSEVDKLAAYRAYIAATKESDNPAAVQSLYERAVLELCLVPDLWEEYVTYVMNQFPGLDYVVLPVCQRSQRNCPWSAALCELHIAALQMFTAEGEEKDTAAKIKKALEKGLGCGLQVGADATRMWMAYLIYLRRQITWSQPHAQELSAFREAAQQAITVIDKYFGEEGDLESLIPRFLARIEAEFVGDCERAREVWNDVIMKRNNNFKNAELWLEFINTERSYGSDKHCRRLCRRALERVWEGIEGIGLAYLRFEQEAGSLETMQEFKKRFGERMAIVNKKRAEDAAKLEAETAPEDARKGKGVKQKDRRSKQGGRDGRDYNQNGTSQEGKVFKVPHPVSKPSKGAKRDTESTSPTKSSAPESSTGASKNIPPPPGFKDSTDTKVKPGGRHEGEIEPPPGFKGDSPKKGTKRRAEETEDERAKRLKVEKQHGVLTRESPLDEMCTLFISNLDFKTTEEEVMALFRSCGDISDFRLVKNFKCLSKGFGYLVFKSHEAAVKGLDMDRTPLNGRPVFVSPYDPENHTHKFKYSTGLEKNKLFISGLPLSMSESDVKAVFEPYGPVKDIRLVTYRNGHSKGLCYLDYHDADTAAKAVEAMNGSELEDKIITVQISNPSAKKSSESVAPKPVMLGEGTRQKKAAGGRGKGMFSLVPRALRQPPPTSTTTATATDAEPSEKSTKKMTNSDFRSLLMK
ncbi:squamous cell carcinoma antigen recognized by T-cells 3-like [Eriocheir sinensis]|uniref:squamous cell carcinoma antigen recognized by T-cells 3-like n=1 Tax=Eriocheir sinensis TaxID=95602 RepID=UPI0021CA2198|nr:squamous cell carcinoma antigen recognized by T-cells 3-like [Eriocheir sinensis]